MTKAMGQVHSVQTFDQQLYAIAKQVEWAIPETFRNHTVRLGGFHTLSCYIAAIPVQKGICWGWFAGKRIGMSIIFVDIEHRRSQRMSDVLERLLEHSVILSKHSQFYQEPPCLGTLGLFVPD
jgi:hypothetical protein